VLKNKSMGGENIVREGKLMGSLNLVQNPKLSESFAACGGLKNL